VTAEDRACAVQLLRSAAADHLTHLDPAERDELVERISAAIDRCGRRRETAAWDEGFTAGQRTYVRVARKLLPVVEEFAAEQLREAADYEDTNGSTMACARLHERAEALAHHEEALTGQGWPQNALSAPVDGRTGVRRYPVYPPARQRGAEGDE
jgi:hypothetical protein